MDKKFLLSVSHELTHVKTRKQLLKTITDLLQPELGFTDYGIFLLNKCQTSAEDLFCDPEAVIKEGPLYRSIPMKTHPADEKGDNFDEISATRNFLSYVKNGRYPGQGFLFNLHEGDLVIGHWVLLYPTDRRRVDAYPDTDFMCLLANQLSIILSKIMKDDAIREREAEFEILQSLNIDFVSIRDKNDLLRLIHVKLKKLFDFGHHWVAVINEDQLTMTSFLQEPASRAKDHPKYQHVIRAKYPINDGIFNKVLLSKEPQVFDLDQLSTRSNMPEYMQILYESGIRKIVMIGLQIGDRIMGVWAICLVSNQQMSFDQLTLVRGISYQLSTAVSNILANEEVSKREEEKSTLLSFSNAIATVRDKKGLGLVIKQHLKTLFGVREYLITIKNDDQETYGYFIHDLETDTPTDEGFQLITGVRMPIAGSMTGEVLRSEVPVIFDLADIRRKAHLSFPSASFWRSAGAERVLGVRLKVAKEDIGILWIQPGLITDHLLQGITAQMAIALANAIANDRIERQLMEINQYKRQLEEEKIYLKEEIETAHNYSEIVGDSPTMKKIFHMVSQVAPSDSTVLILGETGTGKELIARAIHNGSPRKNKLMVKVNCAALPANLVESELFGHERGSFTGATDRRIGKFELANGGTLFLDEIGEMPLELQVKLLRALQEKEIERVGGRSTIKVDVRIIAATNRDLEKEMGEGRFRSDLYYRLNIFPISLPPLRERREDIPQLASHFIQRFAKKAGRNITALSNSALQELIQYNWPGNIRELEHLIERSILQAPGNTLKHIHLPQPRQSNLPASPKESFVVRTIDENERDFIMKTLKYCCGRIAGEGGAAQLLGVPPSTLNSKMKRLGIRREHIS